MITSTGNSAVKRIRALRHRRERDREGVFFAEGVRIVGEAVETGAKIELCVVACERLTSAYGLDLVTRIRDAGAPCLEVSAEVFESISRKEGPQGLGAVVRERWEQLDDVSVGLELCWVALTGVQDPGNLGTVLRTADAVGAGGVILLGQTSDPYDPVAVRASMGAIFSQRLVRASIQELAAWGRREGATLIGTSDAATADYQEVRYPAPLVLLVGSEQHGLSPEEQELADQIVRVPMVGRSDSLNLAVATGVVLYEIFNQRRTS